MDRFRLLIIEDLPTASFAFQMLVLQGVLHTQAAGLPQDVRTIRTVQSLSSNNILDFVRRGCIVLLDANLGTTIWDTRDITQEIFIKQQEENWPVSLIGISAEDNQPLWRDHRSNKLIFYTSPNRYIGKGDQKLVRMMYNPPPASEGNSGRVVAELDSQLERAGIDLYKIVEESVNYIAQRIHPYIQHP